MWKHAAVISGILLAGRADHRHLPDAKRMAAGEFVLEPCGCRGHADSVTRKSSKAILVLGGIEPAFSIPPAVRRWCNPSDVDSAIGGT